MFFQVSSSQPTVQPEAVFHVGDLLVTNAMLAGVFVLFIYVVICIVINKRSRIIPSRFQTIVEVAVESFQNLLEQITGDERKAAKLLPLVGTIFLYIGLGNLIGLVPGVTSFTYDGIQLLRTPTNDFNLTFSIALAIVILTQLASIKHFGIFTHLGKYFKFMDIYRGFKKGIGDGVLAIVDFLIGLLDIISEIAKVVSLSLRLFGNMFAGEVLAAILLGTFGLLIPAPWLAMNLLVGFLQAMVFGALTAAYYTLAVEDSPGT